MKRMLKSVTSFFISMVTAVSGNIIPISVFAEIAESNNPILLSKEIPLEENDKAISIATLSSNVDEGKKYIFTLIRNNSEGDAEVSLKTIDLSAKYGEDYIISDTDYITEETSSELTILEQSADIKEQLNRVEDAKKMLEDAEKNNSENKELDENSEEESISEDESIESNSLNDEKSDESSAEESNSLNDEKSNESLAEESNSLNDEKSDENSAEESNSLNDEKSDENSAEESNSLNDEKSDENSAEESNSLNDEKSDENSAEESISKDKLSEINVEKSIVDKTLEKLSEKTGKSSLAILKESQTGRATRQTDNTLFVSFEDMLAQQTKNDFGEYVETSSSTRISFKDGESTKQIVIEILDDDISEGTEAVDFVISDASEGWNIGSCINCTLTINDNEPVVYSTINFSEAEFNAEKGTAEIKITRSGAEYSLVTAMLRSIEDGTAEAEKNFPMVNTIVEFAPYQNEQVINIPVSSSEEVDFSLELYDIKGGDAGDIKNCKVNIIPAEEYSMNADSNISLLKDENESSFSITLDGKTYKVKYNQKNRYGDIVDESYKPEIVVGKYLFPYSKGDDNEKSFDGFKYDNFSGDKKNADRDSMYIKKGEKNCKNPTGAGYLYWYSWITGRQGSSNCYTGKFDSTPYQYFSTDWEQPESFGGKQLSQMIVNKGTVDNGEVSVREKFSRQMSKSIVMKKGNTPYAGDIEFRYQARDDQSSRTPKNKLYIYGVAGMYRKFKINIVQPDELEFIDESSSTGKVSKAPATVSIGEGHDIRYYGQDLQFKVYENEIGGEILGNIKEYDITVGTGSKKVSFRYKPSGNALNISFNDDFIKLINKQVADSGCSITNEGSGYYTNLTIKPIFEYKNVTIDVNENPYGSFNSERLSVGSGKIFHEGDKLSMLGTSDSKVYVGYNIKSYKNKSDTQPIVNNDVYKTEDTGKELFLTLDTEKYVLKPNFSGENYIGIKLTDEAEKYLVVSNIIKKSDENISSNTKNSMDALDIKYALITDSKTKKVNPSSGKVYTIEVKSKDENYRPVYTLSKDSSKRIVGNCLDFIAEPLASDNIVTIDVEKIDKSDKSKEQKLFAVSGYTMMPDATVLKTPAKNSSQPANNINISAGGEFMKNSGNSYFLSRKTAISDKDGKFQVSGIKAFDGDIITMKVSNGDVEQVEYVHLNSKGLEESDIQYTEAVPDSNGNPVDTPVTNKGYIVNGDVINMAVRSATAPYVSNVHYTVEQIRDYIIDTRNSEIPIISTYIEITADLQLNGRQAKAVIFTRVPKNGAPEETRIESTSYNQREFTARYKLDTQFESGDMLYVSIVDSENMIMEVNAYDENGNLIKTTDTSQEKVYASVYTGLSFYVPNLKLEPQTFDFEGTTSVNIPLLGDIAASQKSGSLTFDKKYYGKEGEANRPYTLSFYFAPGVSKMVQNTAMTTLAKVKQGTNASTNELKNTPEAEIEQAAIDLKTLFNDTDEDMNQAAFEKKYKDLGFKKSLATMSKVQPFDVHMLVLLSFDFFYDYETNQYVMTSGQYCLGAMFTIAKCMYTTIYGVPIYLKVSGTMGVNLSANYATSDSDVINQYDFTATSNISNLINNDAYLTATFGGSAAVGVGLCGVLSARGIVNFNIAGKLAFSNLLVEQNNKNQGFLFKLGGGLGIDLFLFTIEYTPSLLTYGTGCYTNLSNGIISLKSENNSNVRLTEGRTSDMSSFGQNPQLYTSGNSSHTPVSMNVLLNDARERTAPKITTLPNGNKFMVFLANNGSENAINGTSLMYSICDNNGEWSIPQILDNNGTADALPQLLQYDNKVVIVWSDANKKFEENASAKDVLASLEIAYMIYDSETGRFSEKNVITNDEYMDTGESFYIDRVNNKLCCYYVKRDIKTAENEQDLVDVGATYSTIACRKVDLATLKWEDEILLDIQHDNIVDPLIIDFNLANSEFDGKQYVWMTYTIDEDENLNTTDDREVYLVLENVTDSLTYYPIKVTNNYVSDIKPKLTNFNGSIYLSWVSDSKILKFVNISDILENMKNNNIFELYMEDKSENWYKKSAEDLGLSKEEYENTICEKLADNNIAEFGKDFSTEEYIDRSIGNYQIYNDHNKNLYVFWTESGSVETGDGNDKANVTELYGATYVNAGDELGSESYDGWSDAVKITDFGQNIDEFSLTFDENENMYMVSNMFKQTINTEGKIEYSPNKLVEIDFTRDCSLEADGEIEFDKVPADNEEVNISFAVKNNGLLHSDGYDVTVRQVRGDESQIIYSENVDKQIVSGQKDSFNIPWLVSGDIDGMEIVVDIKDRTTGKTVSIKKQIESKADILISNAVAQFDENGRAFISAEIQNNGNIESGEIILDAYENKIDGGEPTVYGNYNVGKLDAGESVSVEYELKGFNSIEKLSKYGTADIVHKCTIDGKEINTTVLSLIAGDVVDISVNDGISEIKLDADDSAELSVSLVPANVPDKTIVYSSSDKNVATVTENGKIIPVGNGVSYITVQHLKTGVSKDIKVTVTGFGEKTNHEHDMEFVPEVPATSTETGTREHWHCTICNKLFADKEGKQEITDIVIPVNSSKNNNNSNVEQKYSQKTNTNKSESKKTTSKNPSTGDTLPVIPATVVLLAIVLGAVTSKKRKD